MHDATDSPWSSSERKLFEEGLIPSPHSVELERTPSSDFMHRFAARQSHVAELYHENSKLTAWSTITVPPDDRKLIEARDWFFSTAYAIDEKDLVPEKSHACRIRHADLPAPIAGLLAGFIPDGAIANRLYGVDLLLLHAGVLYRVLARSPYLWVERHLDAPALAKLGAALPEVDPGELAGLSSYLFLVGVPWRFMMLYGPRGYRHTLLDAGAMLAHLETRAEELGVGLKVRRNFFDYPIERLLFVDGVERSALVVVGIEGDPR